MDYEKVIIYLFNYFFYKIYDNPNYRLDLSINNQYKLVGNFVKLLMKHYSINSIGVGWMVWYFAFCFSYWHDKKTKRQIKLNWIIGKKMFEKWLNRQSGIDYHINNFLAEYNINLDDVRRDLLDKSEINDSLDPAEELEKIRHTGEARLYHCLMFTTMYNHKSINCLSCSNRTMCKRLLEINNPKLYKKRGYEKV